MRGDFRSRLVEKVDKSSSADLTVCAKGSNVARNTAFRGKKVGGLSLTLRGVLEMDEIDEVRLGDLEDPCPNCEEGFRQCGVDLDPFKIDLMARL